MGKYQNILRISIKYIRNKIYAWNMSLISRVSILRKGTKTSTKSNIVLTTTAFTTWLSDTGSCQESFSQFKDEISRIIKPASISPARQQKRYHYHQQTLWLLCATSNPLYNIPYSAYDSTQPCRHIPTQIYDQILFLFNLQMFKLHFYLFCGWCQL